MRVLLSVLPSTESVTGVAPLARALYGNGHHVLLATSASFVAMAEALGINAEAVGPRWTVARSWELGRQTAPRSALEEANALARATTRAALQAAPELLALAARHCADVIVHDQFELAGRAVAEALGVRHVAFEQRHSPGGFTPSETFQHLRQRLGSNKNKVNRRPSLILDTLPDMLRPLPRPANSDRWPIRPEPVEVPTAIAPPTWRSPQENPRILVCLGEAAQRRAEILPPVLDALATEPVDAIIADSAVPSHARRFARSAPGWAIHGLVRDADVMVTSGSSSLALAALASSTPLLLVPRNCDELYIAHRVVGTGSGLAVNIEQFDHRHVRTQLRTLLATSMYSENAARLRAEIAAMPTAADVARDLERWAIA